MKFVFEYTDKSAKQNDEPRPGDYDLIPSEDPAGTWDHIETKNRIKTQDSRIYANINLRRTFLSVRFKPDFFFDASSIGSLISILLVKKVNMNKILHSTINPLSGNPPK